MAGEKKHLARTNTNLSFTPSISATYLFTIDATDSEAPRLRIEFEEPYVGTPVYLRGAMNDWGTGEEFVYQGGRAYTFARDMDPGTYEFKVASEDWDTVSFGALIKDDIDRNLVSGTTLGLARTNTNLVMEVPASGLYEFRVNGTYANAFRLTATMK